jgi:hypothetical protein
VAPLGCGRKEAEKMKWKNDFGSAMDRGLYKKYGYLVRQPSRSDCDLRNPASAIRVGLYEKYGYCGTWKPCVDAERRHDWD